MTTIDETTPAPTDSVALEFDLRHAPQKVWRALTDPTLLAQWLLPIAELSLEPGAAFTFTAPPQPGWDGIVNGRLLEIDAPRTLRWAWIAGGIDTVVTFTLTPNGSGTRLSVVQSGFAPDQKRNLNGARYGWNMMGGKLADLLGTIP